MIFVLFVATRVLAFLAHSSHILLYAPGDSLRRRLRVTPNRLKIVFMFCPGFARLPPCQIPNFSEKHGRLQVAQASG